MHRKLDEYLSDLEGHLKLAPEQKEAELREVRGHLEALVAAQMERGHDRETAMRMALEQFGKAEQLGGDLNRAARQKRLAKSARWIGAGFFYWSCLFAVNLVLLTSMADKPTDTFFSLQTRLMFSALFAIPISGNVRYVERAFQAWKNRRAAL